MLTGIVIVILTELTLHAKTTDKLETSWMITVEN
jgi:hypothetical protein